MPRILLVQDNPCFLNALSELINKRFPRATVELAFNGKEALETLQHWTPELVFVDVRLPAGLNGIGLTGAIKKRYPAVQVIVLSDHDLPEYRTAAVGHGARHYICKSSDTLIEDMLKCIEGSYDGGSSEFRKPSRH